MRLGFSFSREIIFKGKTFGLNADFKNVMRATALLKDESISERARINAALKLLLKSAAFWRARLLSLQQRAELLGEIFKSLNPTASKAKSAAVGNNYGNVLSLEKDGGLIYGAFLQAYRIDLYKDGLDWRLFYELLSSIPESTALFNVMKSRMENPEITQDFEDGLKSLYKNLGGNQYG